MAKTAFPSLKSVSVCGLVVLAALLALPQLGNSQQKEEEPALPERGAVVDIDSPERNLYRIAVPDLAGTNGAAASAVMRNDFKLISLFQLLDPKSFTASSSKYDQKAWQAVGAQGVVVGSIVPKGDKLSVIVEFYETKGRKAAITRNYNGSKGGLRSFMHEFASLVVGHLTGRKAAFNTRLAFARRIGRGRKDVFVSDYDGHGVSRISNGEGVAMLPAFGKGGIWYSRLTDTGMFLTNSSAKGVAVVQGPGLNMGPSICGNAVYFTSTRDGNSEIYRSNLDGTGVKRLTNNPAIDVTATCGPGGKIAFVSSRHGSPQIFTMNKDGSGVQRVTYKGNYNQTPAWCADGRKMAFTGRSSGLDVFVVDMASKKYSRLTQAQGTNKDPAFSPDCRMVAFYSSRGGVYLSDPDGMYQTKIMSGHAETLRWSR